MNKLKESRDKDDIYAICGLIWSITLSAGYLLGWFVALLVSKIQNVPHGVEVSWKLDGSFWGLVVGAGLGGILTLACAKRWINQIKRKHLIITGIGWSLPLIIIFLLVNLTSVDL